ncbi:diguanylate cyclase (GGDEF) domain-containing protein [Klenkia marina]|uniref:Diguanylate cyclase (GGDEF) domain-containing protein n=1 Tax=Klenkia marina TaxID=1960309 RepID=A0A1G4YT30_9ACTN|nr:GGDEF domain-containing protein [Klenkia marina]SCX56590.1 diguanylate cyclase (GGDEF) domain-containing protein [Klenkia marina]
MRRRAPEVATPEVMARTLGVFYTLGGTCGLVALLGSAPDWPRRWAVVAVGVTAIVCGLGLARWGARCPRRFFHAPVAAATGCIALAAALAPDDVTAVVIGALVTFVGVDAFFFFAWPPAVLHLVTAEVLVLAALLARGDVQLTTALALLVAVTAIALVTRRLVHEASRASLDPLTGLANRRGFDDALRELVRPGTVLSAALLDLDDFKQVNDTGGHAAGDAVLRRVATLWGRALPAGAVLARHGGDEFALLLPGFDGARALALVDRLRVGHPDIGMSCGVAERGPRETGAQLMRRADRALYAAKEAGRDRAELAVPLVHRDGGGARVA